MWKCANACVRECVQEERKQNWTVASTESRLEDNQCLFLFVFLVFFILKEGKT